MAADALLLQEGEIPLILKHCLWLIRQSAINVERRLRVEDQERFRMKVVRCEACIGSGEIISLGSSVAPGGTATLRADEVMVLSRRRYGRNVGEMTDEKRSR